MSSAPTSSGETDGDQKAVRILRMPDADMAVGVDHVLFREDTVGDYQILDQGVEAAHGHLGQIVNYKTCQAQPGLARRLGKYPGRDEKSSIATPAFPAKAGIHGSVSWSLPSDCNNLAKPREVAQWTPAFVGEAEGIVVEAFLAQAQGRRCNERKPKA